MASYSARILDGTSLADLAVMQHSALSLIPSTVLLGLVLSACGQLAPTPEPDPGAQSLAADRAASAETPPPRKEDPSAWIPRCPSSASTSTPRALPQGDLAALRGYLDDIRAGVAGHWRGTTSTPWQPSYPVYVAFEADGTYATRSPEGTPVFYYGTDRDTDLKRWSLDELSLEGVASGRIDIAFDYGDDQFGLPGWSGELSDVTLDAEENRLQLTFSTSSGYGPVILDLWRCE